MTMRRIALLIMVICLSWSASLSAQEILTNSDIVQLVKLGMSDDLILAKIEGSSNDFDMSTNMLVALKQDGVSDQVMAAMMKAASDDSKKVVDLNDPLSPHRPGIYYRDGNGDLVELLPTVISQTKDRNRIGAAMSYGISKMKFVSRINGTDARLQFQEVPAFYFYFNSQQASFGDGFAWGFQQATSPNEFLLAELEVKKDVRELETGSSSGYSTEMGIEEELTRDFEIEQLAPGIFKVTPTVLPPGEYCFVFSGAAPYPGSQQKVFDFGVDRTAGMR